LRLLIALSFILEPLEPAGVYSNTSATAGRAGAHVVVRREALFTRLDRWYEDRRATR
jgi:hypothetical protein